MYYRCREMDHGPCPYITNVAREASRNSNYRLALWTGTYGQMTLMSIPVCEDIGLEIHEDTDQFLFIEQGRGRVVMGKCQNRMDVEQCVYPGDVIFVPAGTWHNVINNGRQSLKIASIYAPSHHPWGTVQKTSLMY